MAEQPTIELDVAKVEFSLSLHGAADKVKAAQADLATAIEAHDKAKDAYDAARKAVAAAMARSLANEISPVKYIITRSGVAKGAVMAVTDDVKQESKGGRPAFGEPHTTVTAYIPVRQYDRLVELANQRDQSVSSLVKQLLVMRIPPPR